MHLNLEGHELKIIMCKYMYMHTRMIHMHCYTLHAHLGASQVALVVKNLLVSSGDIRDMGSIPRSGRSPGGGHGNPLQYSCLKNPHGQRSLWATSIGLKRVGHD